MKNNLRISNYRNPSDVINLCFQPPRKCPHCNVSTNNDEVLGLFYDISYAYNKRALIIFFCTACDRFYVAEYKIYSPHCNREYEVKCPIIVYPQATNQYTVSNNISSLSTIFNCSGFVIILR